MPADPVLQLMGFVSGAIFVLVVLAALGTALGGTLDEHTSKVPRPRWDQDRHGPVAP